jgi:hypothetical protein
MTEPAGQQSSAAIFAAQGAARPRLVRAAVAAGIALVAAWLIALALGVLGGFDSLPGLPSSHSRSSTEASSPARHVAVPAPKVIPQSAPAVQRSESPSVGGSGGGGAATSQPKPTASAPTVTQAPSTAGGTTSSTHAQGSAPTTTGKPVGSPGNGPGGSGAPGQLR